ncbi:putative monooxygenase [Gordonia hirsuta DSM 44140 = NBRC 16056]|uniref:Putative monooxygenase n=1 Tax=Gordonia hirsuta DSM 44140 = NBRC 16056 TaxID=1121927 RepID=L7L9J1_9ACTN|nr:NAD(P)/FAD-dependent oxidoreductase [Gordonia hirsuta]GAC56717.1 putative monooxygenase [Gordonia hirsuta DSM 44140 = NBRC 16056]
MTTTTDVLDVLIIGAGISGIGAAHYLTTEHPAKSFEIIESRHTVGGTWDLFKYPGLRSDSDLHTFGFAFKPWTDNQAIADAPRILDYLNEAVDDDDLRDKIRFNRRVTAVDWNSAEQVWVATLTHTDSADADPETETVKARWIFAGTGYYNYDEGFSPEFPGRDDFQGLIVHPQHWPEDLDYAGKKVVVIGSGATAVTLVPSMTGEAEHVTMLQRTPTYVIPLPREDVIANVLKKVLGPKLGYRLSREKNVLQQRVVYELSQRFPTPMRAVIRGTNKAMLGRNYPLDPNFNPPYNPWDQRLCVVPDGDMFKALKRGEATIVTDRIKTFTKTGILLESGTELEADIIVTATGLNLQLLGGMDVALDGEPVDLTQSISYRGMMLSGLPNFAMAIGYTNSSWTLKVDMLCSYFTRLLSHMDAKGYTSVVATPDPGMQTRPLLDFGAGYVQRALDRLPRQGTEEPWKMSMSVYHDRKAILKAPVDDEFLVYQKAVPAEVLDGEPAAV